MKPRCTTLLAVALLAAVFSLTGCGGSDGNDGAAGPAGADGDAGLACWDLNENGVGDLPDEDLNGDGVVDVLDCNALANAGSVAAEIAAAEPESCETCHGAAGATHQAIYDRYVDESNLTLVFDDVPAPVDNGDGTAQVSATFSITKNGMGFMESLDDLDQKRFIFIQYFPATQTYGPRHCYLGDLAATATPGTFTAGPSTCEVVPPITDYQVYGYVAQTPLLEHEGGSGAEIPSSHVHLYDDVANAAWAVGATNASDPGSRAPLASVSGCEKCHGAPYLKHGYRAAVVDPLPDFAACRSCHWDDRNGGHEDWQWMVDQPFAWATNLPGPDEEVRYAYEASLMNDTHMSHAMEFPYPQSMSTCDTCHADDEGLLDMVLADENFTAETCKSCHPVEGVDAWPGDEDDAGSQYAQSHRAPPLEYLWTQAGVDGIHDISLDCQVCHGTGGVSVFTDYHSGYDEMIYDADGNRYADTYTVSIDDVFADLAANTMTVTFSASDPAIVPEVLVSFYDSNTKNFIVPSHVYDASANCPGGRRDNCRFEWAPGDTNPLFPAVSGSGTAGDPWVLTVDMAAWLPGETNDGSANGQPNMSVPDLISDGIVTKAEVTITPELTLNPDTEDEVEVALNAVLQTFDLGANGFVDNYFKGDNAIVDQEKCNVCHDQLAVTFHSGSGRGGDIAMCRNCHNPTFAGSHLEMNSRSIENYVHAIHSFQEFDTDDIFNGGVSDQVPGFDPVYTSRYDLHVKHVFPNFTINNCEACHLEGTQNVPDQSETIPGVLSASYALNTWYDRDADGLVVEDPSGRSIPGTVPEFVTGPASRACGACHRARLINQDQAGGLTSFNAHTDGGGTYSENDPEEDNVLFGVIDKLMSLFR
jgi:OmcA/MtrC family decaheme c-type cytochrome